jgi:hypothetical protein
VLYRVFPSVPGADDHAAGGPLFVPRDRQGAGRHDSPGRYGAFYAARSPVAAVAEAIQAFRGRDLAEDDLARSDASGLALAELDDDALDATALHDLDDPVVLVAEAWRPSWVAGRDRAVTQAMAVRAFDSGRLGLSWWSTIDAAWTNVTLFAERTLDARLVRVETPPERLTLTHPAVIAAAEHLAIPIIARRHRRR